MKKWWRYILGGGTLAALGVFLYSTCYYFLDATDIGLSRNLLGGQVELRERTGIHFKTPFELVSIVDTLPTRVCITTSAHAAFNCKLVRFVPEKWEDFIRTEGFGLYWWRNRFSVNFGYREEYRGMKDVLRGYAFSSERYAFIEELDSYGQR